MKADLRKQLRGRLEHLSFQALVSKSGDLTGRFQLWSAILKTPGFKGKTVLSFCPFDAEPQIQIEPFVEHVAYLRIEDWDKRVMHPREARRDIPGQWEEFEVPGSGHRIFHPLESQPLIRDEQITAVLVPGLGFTVDGTRLGRGAGFYDRYLSGIPAALRIGVAFEVQMLDSLPKGAHDAEIDMILTESRQIETIRYSQWKNHGRIERE
ncbi:MAG: 5-formyltetrahydrofolate cyclo-ligase [Bdellovibrionales bacterium]|nr:5-formyltetrahydrofolate cyclo-ligase [Bdellovibrionales bacterium]